MERLKNYLQFINEAEQLKNVLRTAWTSEGKQESTAAVSYTHLPSGLKCYLQTFCREHAVSVLRPSGLKLNYRVLHLQSYPVSVLRPSGLKYALDSKPQAAE